MYSLPNTVFQVRNFDEKPCLDHYWRIYDAFEYKTLDSDMKFDSDYWPEVLKHYE